MNEFEQENKQMEKPEKQENGLMRETYDWIESCLYAFVVILLIFTFFVRNATVFGYSMEPTLQPNDRLIVQQIGYDDPQYGDIVVVDRSQTEEDTLIKRVIGKPGDIIYIDFQTGEVWRNDQLLDEPYINEPTLSQYDVQFPVTVPEGHLFVMGDNRNHSSDSRLASIGMIDCRRVAGKAIFRFLPLQKVGPLS